MIPKTFLSESQNAATPTEAIPMGFRPVSSTGVGSQSRGGKLNHQPHLSLVQLRLLKRLDQHRMLHTALGMVAGSPTFPLVTEKFPSAREPPRQDLERSSADFNTRNLQPTSVRNGEEIDLVLLPLGVCVLLQVLFTTTDSTWQFMS